MVHALDDQTTRQISSSFGALDPPVYDPEAAQMKIWLALLTLSGLTTTGATVWANDAPATRLVVGVEDSMPVLGRPCRLWSKSP